MTPQPVIARKYDLIDRSSGDFGQMLRTPDLRLGDVRTILVQGRPPLTHLIDDPGRGVFVYVLKGDFALEIEGSTRGWIPAPEGTAVGFESGRPHRWRAQGRQTGAEADAQVELFVSSIPRRQSVLQRLEDGMILAPPDAQPFARILRHAVEAHLADVLDPPANGDDAVVRRCAEICLIQFVRYAQAKVLAQPDAPARLAHDEHLLRAWSAYFADPRRRWTVQALARAAGLGRSSFSERFHKVFGGPPLQTLTTLRLEQAETMLRRTQTPLIEIAFTVGYNSEAAFVRAFHRAYGVPPGRFRKQYASVDEAS